MTELANTNIEARTLIIATQKAIEELVGSGYMQKDNSSRRDFFCEGIYAREFFMPAGSLIVGKIHKYAHINNISSGIVHVFTEQGGRETYCAPCQFISPAGTKRVVLAETDTTWTTYHATVETDADVVESMVTVADYSDLDKISYEELKGLIV